MTKRLVLLVLACVLALTGCDGGDGRDETVLETMEMATPDNAAAMRWWNALTPEQVVAALYGDEATAEQTAAAQKMYAELDDDTKARVTRRRRKSTMPTPTMPAWATGGKPWTAA